VLPNPATATLTTTTYSNQTSVLGALVLLGVAWAVGYLLWCWISPFTHCRRCNGLGKRRARYGRGFRHCHHCDGSGYQLRPGRHILNHLRRRTSK
jgi:hypothetical protein